MENYYYAVLHVDKQRALGWSYIEEDERWVQLENGDILVGRWIANPIVISDVEKEAVFKRMDVLRERLYELGWPTILLLVPH